MNKMGIKITFAFGIVILLGAIGYLAWPKRPSPSPIPQPPQSFSEETADWKTYRNNTYDFEIKYPSDWIFEDKQSDHGGFFYVAFGASTTIGSEPLATMKIYPGASTLDGFVKQFDYIDGTRKDINLDNLPAKEITSVADNSKEFTLLAVVETPYGYELTSTASGPSVDIVRKMASTLNFLSMWQTYRNDQLGFEAEYPNTWTVTSTNSSVTFSLPDAPYGTSKEGEEVKTAARVYVSKSSNPEYSNLADLEKWKIDYYKKAGDNWNWKNLGYEQINGRTFFEDSIVHQISELRYATFVNGQMFQITLNTQDAIDFETLASYQDFLRFIHSLKTY